VGIWVTCAKGQEGRATEELKIMFAEVNNYPSGEKMPSLRRESAQSGFMVFLLSQKEVQRRMKTRTMILKLQSGRRW